MSPHRPYTFPGRRWLLVAAGVVGLVAFLCEYGLRGGAGLERFADVLSWVSVGLFGAETALAARGLRPWRVFLRRRWPVLALTLLLGVEVVVVSTSSWLTPLLDYFSLRLTRAYVIVAQFYILGSLLVHLPQLDTRAAYRRVRPGVAFVAVFVALIFVGAALLLLPGAVPAGSTCNVGEALFTSTSAVCVTGLIVRDTATEFSSFGLVVILALIQLGGLGIMSLTATMSLLLGRGIGLRESSLLREVFQVPLLGEVGRTLRFIVLLTVVCEAVGAAVLYVGLSETIAAPRERLLAALFHSVSAFCNAGFSTFGDSLIGLGGNGLVVGTISVLLIVGGIGFAVVANLLAWLRGRALRARERGLPRARIDINTRLVLSVTGILLLGGTVAILALEWSGALAGLPWWQKAGQAFFQSATTRTAGFNSLDLTALSHPTLLLMIVLMFVGAAPGSTAGGVKVTVVALLWANLLAIGRGWRQPRLLDREIDSTTVNRALLVLSAGLVLAAVGTFVLLISERADFVVTVFEVFSAIGTVGLSLGLTPELSAVGRIVIIVLMFVGRLGPLTMAYGLVKPSRERNLRLPRGRIMVG